jgi:hypothetical protein
MREEKGYAGFVLRTDPRPGRVGAGRNRRGPKWPCFSTVEKYNRGVGEATEVLRLMQALHALPGFPVRPQNFSLFFTY